MDSFKELTYEKKLGFYNSCDLIKIFITDKSNNKIITFYALFLLKEEAVTNSQLQYITPELEYIDDTHSLGIVKKELSLDEASEFYNKLLSGNINEEIEDIWINCSELWPLEKQFVLDNSTRINNILKGNGSGSYIFEFFEEDKQELEFIINNDELFNRANEIITENTDFDFELTKDRIGNYIFQMPVTLLSTSENFDADELTINFNWNRQLNDEYPDCFIIISSKDENIHTTSHFEKYTHENEQVIKLGRKYDDLILSIWLEKEELLILEKNIPLLHEAEISIKAEYGTRTVEKNGELLPIKLEINDEGKIKQQKFKQIINATKIKNNEEKIKKELAFVEYQKLKNPNQPDKYDDLIYLINEHGKNGVYIWDSYLTANDLLDTAFHLKYYNKPIKAITSKNIMQDFITENEEKSIDEIIRINHDIIHESDTTGLNLEFRIELGKPSFHDRFLIFPPNPEISENAIVYSLGTSINGFRKSNHILQKVSVPNDILNSFNELWDKLDKDENKIW